MPHQPAWHVLDSVFTDENDGLFPPSRRTSEFADSELAMCRTHRGSNEFNTLAHSSFGLRITNLSRDDPPNYTPGVFHRENTFNANSGSSFRISREPRMPVITVECEAESFDPRISTIHWRLQCRHVLCRHQPVGNYQYRGACEVLEDEWQGKSRSATFNLFQAATSTFVDYDYNTNDLDAVVMGGNAILSVAAMPSGCSTVLLDYVHLRIGGTNPGRQDVVDWVDRTLNRRDPNLPDMVNAIFTHENNYRQFADGIQSSTRMRFRQQHHQNDATQPDCNVRFDWPDDPAHYPSVSFDWGVGISQYTKIRGRTIGREATWDWRGNLKGGINEFLAVLRRTHQANSTWRQWAHRAWRAYNGGGPQAGAYANTLEALPEGQRVSTALVPSGFDVSAFTVPLAGPPARGSPPSWPPFHALGDYTPTSRAQMPA